VAASFLMVKKIKLRQRMTRSEENDLTSMIIRVFESAPGLQNEVGTPLTTHLPGFSPYFYSSY